VAIAASVFLGFGENATAFAHLNEQGVPTLTKFTNDVRPLGEGQTRIYARHAAAFGDVNVYLRSGRKTALIQDLENPDQEGANLPAGTWLEIGTAVIEVTAPPHTGCAKFSARFGSEALRFVNSPEGRELRLRGLNARVVRPGTVRRGDQVRRLPSPGNERP
jgi:hypothetical protein